MRWMAACHLSIRLWRRLIPYLGRVGHPFTCPARDGHLCIPLGWDHIPFHFISFLYQSIFPLLYPWEGWLPIAHLPIYEHDGHLSRRSWPPTRLYSKRWPLMYLFWKRCHAIISLSNLFVSPPMYLWGGWLPIMQVSIYESDGHLSRIWSPTCLPSRRWPLMYSLTKKWLPFHFIDFIYL